MNPEKIRQMRVAMTEALSLIEKDFGVKFAVGNASYTLANVTFKVTGSEIAADGTVKSPDVDKYNQYKGIYGLPDIGTTFRSGGREFKIVGFKPKSPRFPVLATSADGRTYKFAVESVTGKGRSPFADFPQSALSNKAEAED